MRHASATAGTMLGEKYRFDMVRAGIGLYGYYPSKELEVQLGDAVLKR
jgi:alanine racemase